MNLYRLLWVTALTFILNIGFAQKVTLEVELSCPGATELTLFGFAGFYFEPLHTVAVNETKATFTLDKGASRFYYLGMTNQDVLPIILGEEEKVNLFADCRKISNSKVQDSPINREYQVLKGQINVLKTRATQASRKFAQQLMQGEQPQEFIELMTAVDQEKKELLEKSRAKNAFLGQVAAFNTQYSYFLNSQNHPNELMYFGSEYFSQIDLTHPELAYMPWVYEGFKEYTATLAGTGAPENMLIGMIDARFNEIPKGSRTGLLAISGIIGAVEKDHYALFTHYVDRFEKDYAAAYPEVASTLRTKMKSLAALAPNAEAPLFEQAKSDGTPLVLKDLRGKVLLIDFWASWCGPCRRDNPHVRALYDKYKDHGFDILGVSLDSDRTRWLDAIEKDGLIWHHCSDLKGWQNAAAKLYGVSSIPHTVLLDAEGKIIARKLRGPSLDQKLQEIFGF